MDRSSLYLLAIEYNDLDLMPSSSYGESVSVLSDMSMMNEVAVKAMHALVTSVDDILPEDMTGRVRQSDAGENGKLVSMASNGVDKVEPESKLVSRNEQLVLLVY